MILNKFDNLFKDRPADVVLDGLASLVNTILEFYLAPHDLDAFFKR
jgi:hypothetical protein